MNNFILGKILCVVDCHESSMKVQRASYDGNMTLLIPQILPFHSLHSVSEGDLSGLT